MPVISDSSLKSTLGWIELSPAALRKMRSELEETEEGVRDEMGVLAIHRGYADRFFPGTSVLQTRPRYLFFTCWNYLVLTKQTGVGPHNAWEKKREAENWVTKRLNDNEDSDVIGGSIHPRNPVQSPDFIYWTALKTYGFYKGPERRPLLSNWDGELVGRVNDRARNRNKERLFKQIAL